ncbi:MAG: TlpA disulfide reductase family protein, partial [Planctomycetota bacterium]
TNDAAPPKRAPDAAIDLELLKHDDFSKWRATKHHYFVKPSADGSIQIDGVPPGDYDLVIQLYEEPAGCLVETIGQKIVPISVDAATNIEPAIDLGEIAVECRSGPRVGSDMRAFKFIDASNRQRSVNDMKDRYVLFHVWASWCAPCIATMPTLKAKVDGLKESALTVVGLNVDETDQQAAAKRMASEGDWNWSMNYLGSDSPMMRQLAVSSVPAYYLIGPDGKLVMSSNRWSDVQAKLDSEFVDD